MLKEKQLLYKKANVELYEIIMNLTKKEQEMIPIVLLNNLKKNMDNNYKFEYDNTKTVSEQNIMDETKALLIQIYIRYLSPKEENEIWNKYKKICLNKIEEDKKEKYNPNGIFIKNENNENKIINESINMLPIELKHENIFKRVFNYIRKFLKK